MLKDRLCGACGASGYLVIHHWRELGDGKRQTKLVCMSCNQLLRTDLFWGLALRKSTDINKLDHILPKWDYQVEYVQQCRVMGNSWKNIKFQSWLISFREKINTKQVADYVQREKRSEISVTSW
jgi:hypothetical protein